MLLRAMILLFAFCAIRIFAECEPCDRLSNAVLLPPMTGDAGQFEIRRSGLEVDARWKLGVDKDGWYRLTWSQLVAAGLPADQLIGSQIRLFNRTNEVAISVTSTNVWGEQDALYFYGIQHDGPYNRTNAYWLGLGGLGKRIESVNGSTNAGGNVIINACYSANYNPKKLHRPYHRPDDESIDHWFAEIVYSDINTGPIFINTSNRNVSGNATFGLTMYGLTLSNHQTRVTLQNGHHIVFPPFNGAVLHKTNLLVAASNFAQLGMSTLTFRQIGTNAAVPLDYAYLVEARVDYLARMRMRSPASEFCGLPGTNIYNLLSVATNVGNTVLDITDPHNPTLITDVQFPPTGFETNFFTALFRHVSQDVRRYAIIQTNGILNAQTPHEVRFRNLGDMARRADYLMIGPTEFRAQMYRLAKQRFTNGLNIVVAPLNDVYNEFGYGIVDADAIKQFIGYAYHHWTPPKPRFALLIGEGTYDPLGHIGSIPAVNVPVKFGPTPFVVAAKDTWYGLVDGDDLLPDVIVGRMSLSSGVSLSNVVSKVIHHDAGGLFKPALLVSDFATNINFKGSTDTYIYPYLFSNGYLIQQASLPSATQTQIVSLINSSGNRLITYVGHGALNQWSSANLLNVTNMSTLSNTTYPLVAIFSCQNGSFVERLTNCLSEAFIEVHRGAASVFSPTALSVQLYADYVAQGFANSLASRQRRYLGDVAFEAAENLFNFNPFVSELSTYQILGDPGLIVNRPGTLP
ncbi:MAG TPA: C25 family cysteine peptidase [Kiritimatiellia bacterium]|nr:C25 family cysteine peptidase [Kiritimatiellia bacterium]